MNHGLCERVHNRAVTNDTQMRVRYRTPSPVWGDETAAVMAALQWANQHTVVATDPKTTARPASELHEAIGETITPAGIGWAEAITIFDEIAVKATRAQDDPYNLAFIPAAPTRAAVAFDSVVSSANIFGGMWDAGSGAIHLENQALGWLIGLLDWPETAAGCFVSGGTIGNLSALTAARHRARTRGERPASGWKIAASAGAHSSIAGAAAVLDVDIVWVPVDESGHMTGAALRAAIENEEGVFAVVASAGTTNIGIIDDLADIADVAEEHDLWMHVDGAYGGAALASRTARPLFNGIERADSFIVDPHKWLFAPYDCCALIYRDAAAAHAAHAQHASYLDAIDRTQSNPADLAIHLSRRTRGLPLWYSLAVHGTDRYEEAIDRCMQAARRTAAGIAELEHLELLVEPELTVVTFRRRGWDAAAHLEWSNRMAHDGVIFIVPTALNGESVLRLVIVNPETDPRQILRVLDHTMR